MDVDENVDTEVRDFQAETISAKSASDLVSDSASGSVSNLEKPNKNRKVKYIILSIVALVLILSVAAVVFIIVNKSQKDGGQFSTSVSDSTDPAFAANRKANQIHDEIQASFDEDGDLRRLIESYTEAINTALSNGEHDLAIFLVELCSAELIFVDSCDDAEALLPDFDISKLDNSHLRKFYLSAAGISSACGDTDGYNYWQSEADSLLEEIEETEGS